MFGKKLTCNVLTIILIFTFTRIAFGKSVYVITEHEGDKLAAYDIQADEINYQATATLPVSGPVGLALDPDSGVMFTTYEGSNVIEMVSARTLAPLEISKTVTEASNLAGIAFDQSKQKLYTVDRGTDNLFIYFWNATAKTLTPDQTNPKILTELTESGGYGAYGIALDESRERLYVTNATSTVHFYDTNDWSHVNDVNVGRVAVSLAVDPNKNYLYTGAFTGVTGQHNFLVRTNISDINNPTVEDYNVGNYVIGIAVDEQTGFIYTTDKDDEIKVFNSTTFPSDPCYVEDANISKPADIIIAGDMSYKLPLLKIRKIDDAGPDNRPLPGQYIDYTIFYDANGHSVTDLNIIDYLPDELDFNSASEPNIVDYNSVTHTVTWSIGSLSPTDSNSLTLKVDVNSNAPFPLETIINFVEAESDSSYNFAYCLTPDVIYVDADANAGSDTGLSWQNAFLDLQDALKRAKQGIGSRIWIAEGNYHPTDNPTEYSAAFNLENNLTLYGGFAANETHLSQRNYLINETVLSGDIDDDNDTDAYYVVKAVDVTQTARIDGFTIKGGSSEGIYLSNSSLTVANNKITKNYRGIRSENLSSTEILNSSIYSNDDYGIYCNKADETNISNCTIKQNGSDGIKLSNGELVVHNCFIKDNNGIGIYTYGSSSGDVTNNKISNNKDHGLQFDHNVQVEFKNNWVYSNGTDDTGNGIYFDNDDIPDTPIIIRNNTVTKNADYGIQLKYPYPEDVNVSNCIIWNNDDDLKDCSATYSCIKDNDSGQGNIHSDPCFVDDVNDNYHISPNSPCIDAGNTALITDQNETDIDPEPRVWDGDFNDTDEVDIGADEVYYSPADFDSNNIVNFLDYAMFADSWCMNPTENPNDYNDLYDLKDNNSIDSNDLDRFCHEWLWEPAWTKNAEEMMMHAGSTTYMTTLPVSTSVTTLYTPTTDQLLKFQPPPLDMEETIKWLEYLWLTDPLLRENIDEKQWLEFIEDLEFIEAVEDSFKDFLP